MAITMNASQASMPSALFHNEEAYDDDDDDDEITYGELQDDEDEDDERVFSRRPSKEISLDLDDLLEEIENENNVHASNSNSGSLAFHMSSRLHLEDLPDCPCGLCLDDKDECLSQQEKKVRFGGSSKPPKNLLPCSKLPSKRRILDERSSCLSKKIDSKNFAKDILMGLEIVTTTTATSPNESSSSMKPIQQQRQVGSQQN